MATEDKLEAYRATALSNSPTFHFPDYQQSILVKPFDFLGVAEMSGNILLKTFPDDFYRQMFRLRGWQYYSFSVKRPSVAGRITNDIIYERLAPGVLDELRRITPKDVKGRRKHRYHQRLTKDIGNPALREHIASVVTLMKASTSWRRFYAMLNRALPRWGSTLPMALDFKEDEEVS